MKMKKIFYCMALAMVMASCGNAKNANSTENSDASKSMNDSIENASGKNESDDIVKLEWEKYSFKETSKYCIITLSVEVPVAKENVSTAIRNNILATLARDAAKSYSLEDDKDVVKKYTGSTENLKEVVDYYGKALVREFNKYVKADIDWMNNSEGDGKDVSKEDAAEEITPWEYSLEIKKSKSPKQFVIVESNGYGYWGGAHGGVIGSGSLTYYASNGQRVTNFFKPNAEKKMQALLKKGLKEYFSENGEKIKSDDELMDRLMLMDKDANPLSTIPLPYRYYPCPTAEGLIFTYAQYEVACYAAGMPSFTLTYDELRPYLNDEFIKEIGK